MVSSPRLLFSAPRSYQWPPMPSVAVRADRFKPPELTDQQQKCLYWAAKGKSDLDIGEIMSISPRTVNYHMELVREKFNVRTRAQVISITTSCGMIFP
ncbi:MAG: hypothetical protein COB54_06705 [Alphaproteobacteria bacterium]|nr:MAG: hypothetical protein COB54_06705 [Alphaproteobacteria bacterium]